MTEPAAPVPTQRLDKWLWCARFFKTRTGAARAISEGAVRLNGTRVSKPATALKPGDTLTFVQGQQVRVVQMQAVALRRGPAPEAQTLYADLNPPNAQPAQPRVGARPTKKDRRDLDALRDFDEG